MSPFSPYSPQAKAISDLFILVLGIGAVILLIVLVLTVVAIIRFRDRRGEDTPPRQVFGNRKLEIAWTAAPALLLVFIFVLTVRTANVSDPPVVENDPDIIVIGHQWWWEFRYPKDGVITANELHMPVDTKMVGLFESADVIHDFWVPQIGRKIDLVPGHPNSLYLQVNKTGTYLGTCAEFCGAEHAWMRIRVIVQTQEEYDAWIKQQQQIPAVPTTGPAAQGAQLFQNIACQSCHRIAGTQANGTVGPDLTHLASRETIGAGVLKNNRGSLLSWVSDAQASKPGIYMPPFTNLSSTQLNDIVAYLETLK